LVQRYGRASLPENHIFPCTGHLNLVYTIPELQPPSPIIDASFCFVGPSLAPRLQDSPLSLPEGRIVYISLGTVHTANRHFYATCFEAFGAAPGHFVLAAGDLANRLSPPPNFIVRSHVPQLEILQRADLFITHAGINSLHESLAFGVPMVMAPQQIEQAMNARITASHHLGVIVGGSPPYGQNVSATQLAAAANVVLTDPTYRASSQRMASLLQAAGGSRQAIEAILELGAARSPG
jgi:MGT family glycosyltransferase